MDNIINLGRKSGQGNHSSVSDALEECIEHIGKKGAFEKGNKILILCLDDTDNNYSVSFVQAGMKMSDCNNLCDIGKNIFKNEMGY